MLWIGVLGAAYVHGPAQLFCNVVALTTADQATPSAAPDEPGHDDEGVA